MAEQIQKDITSLTNKVIESARTSSIIYEGSRTGKSDQEIVAGVFGDQGLEDFARSITIVNLLKLMGDLFHLHPEDDFLNNKAFTGYALIMQHHSFEPLAKKYIEMYNSAETVEDVWNYFLYCNSIAESEVVKLPGYDHDWFWQLMKRPIKESPSFCFCKP